MNSFVAELDGKQIAASVAVRAKALSTLKSLRRPSVVAAIVSPSAGAVVAITVRVSEPHLSLWSMIILGSVCGLGVAAFASLFRIQRQLSAAIDLLLLNEDRKP